MKYHLEILNPFEFKISYDFEDLWSKTISAKLDKNDIKLTLNCLTWPVLVLEPLLR